MKNGSVCYHDNYFGDIEKCFMTVASHGFSETQDVHHPDPTDAIIGTITTRIEDTDIALVKLRPSMQ